MLLLAFITITVGCSDQKETYSYVEGMQKYFAEQHNEKLLEMEDVPLFFLNVESCQPCVHDNLAILSSLKNEKITVVLIGYNPEVTDQYYLPDTMTLFFDKQSAIVNYRTGMGKPMLLYIKEGSVDFYRIYESTEAEDFKKDLLALR